MIRHSEILDKIRSVRTREEEIKREFKSRELDREELLDFTFRSGEEVFDPETQQKGVVLHVTRKRITQVPGPGSGGSRSSSGSTGGRENSSEDQGRDREDGGG